MTAAAAAAAGLFIFGSGFFHKPAIRLLIFDVDFPVKLELLRDGGCVANGSVTVERLLTDGVAFNDALLLERCGTVGVLGER